MTLRGPGRHRGRANVSKSMNSVLTLSSRRVHFPEFNADRDKRSVQQHAIYKRRSSAMLLVGCHLPQMVLLLWEFVRLRPGCRH